MQTPDLAPVLMIIGLAFLRMGIPVLGIVALSALARRIQASPS